MGAAFRILGDVLVYRIRKLEMANLVAVVAILVALRRPIDDTVVRTGFAVLLNLLAYLTNDYCDLEHDLATGREREKTLFLYEHRSAALWVQVGLVALLAGIAVWWSPGLLIAIVAGAGVCWLYSAKLKHAPFVDITLMAAWGVGMTLVAFPLDSALGWVLVLELGLFSAGFETIQVIRDRQSDAASRVRTTAVVLGERTSLILARAFMVLAALYGTLVLHRWIGVVLFVAPLLPLDPKDPERYWNHVRAVQGAAWLGILASVLLAGRSDGWVMRVVP